MRPRAISQERASGIPQRLPEGRSRIRLSVEAGGLGNSRAARFDEFFAAPQTGAHAVIELVVV